MDDRDGFLFCVVEWTTKRRVRSAVGGGTHKSPEGAADEGTERGEEESNSWCQKIPKPDAVPPSVRWFLWRSHGSSGRETAGGRAGMCDR